ncbi:MAG TPA: type VI secretion protein IcmF/TssM N-terminal domain-containing protein [Candidatus Acidoferrum sp.]|jgi:hypothetical protein|nr:type VI secretion protein IcmF/TssM N-terminal domain-containing protein [Candidatus Acidoferrum sp.]
MDKISNLPSPIKWILGVTGLGALLGVGGAVGRGSWKLLLIFAVVLIVLLVVIVGGYMLWHYLQRRKQNARLRGELQQSTTAAPRGMSPTDLAKLDSLRKKFQDGVDAFRSRGKDLYTLPWYVIIGEPGSGKTEAVRHCNVGFPPGMHEGDNDTGYMGAGGTINMNWWFTNYAVLLDTAGRLVFEEVKPGETSEWKEFLKLLKKNRPYCPVNGLLLVIPSDSLIKDSADQIAAKAGKIAQQLDVIQRVLDFRFPVYVVITKSDKINGFREFFEGLTDPQLQHQILGWANPEQLDTPFKPESVENHLTQVAERLRKRRLGLMRDPVAESAPRRTDEVDSLFALPNSLLMLAPRLRRYLETIFMPGEWSAKPLFLRGIYFTSSMREGSALDQELAEAIGVAADELPEGKVWERERAYFLRDLFMEKVFKEKGLVTRATNTDTMLRRRQLVLYVSCFIALTIFVVIAWLGMRTVRGQVKDRADYWAAAAAVGWDEHGTWNRPLFRLEDEGNFTYVTNRFTFADRKMTLGEFQGKLHELAESEIQGRWTSPGLASSYNKDSKRSQRVIFETAVLKPLRDALDKTVRNPAQSAVPSTEPDAVAALIRLESDVQSRRKGDTVEMDSRAAGSFLGLFSRFVTGQDASEDTNLVSAMVWTYSSNRFGQGAWPPAWLSATVITNGVATNALLQAGLDYCIRTATNTVRDVGTNWNQVTELQAAFRTFEGAEKNFFGAARAGDRNSAHKSMQALKDSKTRLDMQLAGAAKNDLFKGGVLFGLARQAYTNQIMTYAWGAFEKIERANTNALRKQPDYAVFTSIAARLAATKGILSSSVTSLISAGDADEFSRFDQEFLAAQSGSKAFEQRSSLYERAARLSDEATYANVAGPELAAKLDQSAAERGELAKLYRGYGGYASNDVAAVGQFYLGPEFADAFRQQAGKALEPYIGFPLVQNSSRTLAPANLESATKAVQTVAAAVGVAGPELQSIAAWKTFAARLQALNQIALFLKGKEGKPMLCTITLRRLDDNSTPEEKLWRARFRAIRLGLDGSSASPMKIQSDEDLELGKVSVSKACKFQLFQLADDKDPAQSLADPGDWSPLQLIFKYGAKPEREGVLTSWIVQRKFKTAGENRDAVLGLKLVFDGPLADLDSWPKD